MDSEQLGILIDRHAAVLELYARQWCDEPEDVVQDAFVKLAGQGTVPRNVPAWLFAAVRNGAINAGIARRRRREHETRAGDRAPRWFDDDDARSASSVVDMDAAQQALASLPLDQREPIVAHLWGGLTFEQIAKLTGTSSSTAHRLYQTGMNALRERLGVICRTTKNQSTGK
jgi:RNA polymerase sigma-70 factor (ECF subfamily)